MLGSMLFSPEQIVSHAFVEPVTREPVLFFLNGLHQLSSFYLALFFFSSFLFPPIFPFLSFAWDSLYFLNAMIHVCL